MKGDLGLRAAPSQASVADEEDEQEGTYSAIFNKLGKQRAGLGSLSADVSVPPLPSIHAAATAAAGTAREASPVRQQRSKEKEQDEQQRRLEAELYRKIEESKQQHQQPQQHQQQHQQQQQQLLHRALSPWEDDKGDEDLEQQQVQKKQLGKWLGTASPSWNSFSPSQRATTGASPTRASSAVGSPSRKASLASPVRTSNTASAAAPPFPATSLVDAVLCKAESERVHHMPVLDGDTEQSYTAQFDILRKTKAAEVTNVRGGSAGGAGSWSSPSRAGGLGWSASGRHEHGGQAKPGSAAAAAAAAAAASKKGKKSGTGKEHAKPRGSQGQEDRDQVPTSLFGRLAVCFGGS